VAVTLCDPVRHARFSQIRLEKKVLMSSVFSPIAVISPVSRGENVVLQSPRISTYERARLRPCTSIRRPVLQCTRAVCESINRSLLFASPNVEIPHVCTSPLRPFRTGPTYDAGRIKLTCSCSLIELHRRACSSLVDLAVRRWLRRVSLAAITPGPAGPRLNPCVSPRSHSPDLRVSSQWT